MDSKIFGITIHVTFFSHYTNANVKFMCVICIIRYNTRNFTEQVEVN